jgi:hypothetical protein
MALGNGHSVRKWQSSSGHELHTGPRLNRLVAFSLNQISISSVLKYLSFLIKNKLKDNKYLEAGGIYL